MLVEIASVEQDTEVLQDRRNGSRSGLDLLESLDRLGRSQNASRGVGRDLGSLTVLSLLEEVLELLNEQLIGSWQVGPRSHADGEVSILQLVCRNRLDQCAGPIPRKTIPATYS